MDSYNKMAALKNATKTSNIQPTIVMYRMHYCITEGCMCYDPIALIGQPRSSIHG